MTKKNLKLENLAVIINHGFNGVQKRLDQTSTKQEVQELRKDMTESLRIISDDVHDLKVAMGPLVRVMAAFETDVRNLNLRVNKIERRVGLAR